jgi:hypothetical protein
MWIYTSSPPYAFIKDRDSFIYYLFVKIPRIIFKLLTFEFNTEIPQSV